MNKKQLERFADYAAVFTSAAGQRVLDDLRRSFDRDHLFDADPRVTAFNLGMREVYRRILHCVAQASKADEPTTVEA